MMRRFSEFAKSECLDGDKMQVAELFNKEIIILAFRIIPSKCVTDKPCLQLQFQFAENPRKYICFSNSTVLIKQMEEYQKELPFIATIIKRGSYYTLS